MYGLIGKIVAVAGRRDVLVGILSRSTSGMPGCLSYVIATDPADENAIWVTEVWESEESHRASLGLAQVKAAIAEARPMIARFENRVVTRPVARWGAATTEVGGPQHS